MRPHRARWFAAGWLLFPATFAVGLVAVLKLDRLLSRRTVARIHAHDPEVTQ